MVHAVVAQHDVRANPDRDREHRPVLTHGHVEPVPGFPSTSHGMPIERDMTRLLTLGLSALLVLLWVPAVFAQLVAAKEGPVVYGHHHLNTTNLDAQKK